MSIKPIFARGSSAFAMRRAAFILAALLAASLVGACGQKGPLKLPPEPPKVAPATPAPRADAAPPQAAPAKAPPAEAAK